MPGTVRLSDRCPAGVRSLFQSLASNSAVLQYVPCRVMSIVKRIMRDGTLTGQQAAELAVSWPAQQSASASQQRWQATYVCSRVRHVPAMCLVPQTWAPILSEYVQAELEGVKLRDRAVGMLSALLGFAEAATRRAMAESYE